MSHDILNPEAAGRPRTMLDGALALAARGWRVFPCEARGKVPITSNGVKDATHDPAQIEAWWTRTPNANIGLACGPEVVVVDFDGDELPDIPHTLTVMTSRGRHIYLDPAGDTYTNRAHLDGCKVDVRGAGGYVIAPPSVHKSGHVYAWATDAPLAPVPPAWRTIMQRQLPVAPPPVMRKGSVGDAFDRARKYLRRMPPGIDGQYGSNATFAAALAMTKGFELSEADALDLLLSEFNPRCVPPWSLDELRHKVHDAAAASEVPLGYLLRAEPPERRGAVLRRSAAPDTRDGAGARTSPNNLHPEDTMTAPSVNHVDKVGRLRPANDNHLANDATAPRPANDDTWPAPDDRPCILLVPTDQRTTRLAVERELGRHPRVTLFQAAGTGALVVVDDLGESTEAGGARLAVTAVTEPRLCELITDVAVMLTTPPAGREGDPYPTRPPAWLPKGILAAFDSRFPTLVRIIDAPTLRPDGTVLDTAGHDSRTGLLYAPSRDYPPIPESPTFDDARAAALLLLDVLRDFPFAAPHHRAAALAAIMTPVLRHAITGPTPAFAIDATTPGTGKGMLADIVALIATGQPGAIMPLTDDTELEKRITALVLDGVAIVVLDNIEAPVGGAVLASLLTSDRWRGRLLGKSQTVDVPQRMTILMTGNQLRFRGDVPRRILRIYMEPPMERPEERSGFTYSDLRAHVREHRPDLVCAVLTIARGYAAAGSPLSGTLPATGTFESWSRVVREPLAWLGFPDAWALGQRELREADDPFLDGARDLLAALGALYPNAREWNVAQLEELRATASGICEDTQTVVRVLSEWVAGAKSPARAIADKLGRIEGRILRGRRLVKGLRTSAGRCYAVERVDAATDAAR